MSYALSRIVLLSLTVVFAGITGGPVLAAAAQKDYDDCSQTKDTNLAIVACTRIGDDKSTAIEDRLGAIFQSGNAYFGLNDINKALSRYQAAEDLVYQQDYHGPLVMHIGAAKAIAYWQLYQVNHDPDTLDSAIDEFKSADGIGIDQKDFDALVQSSTTLQDIKRHIQQNKK